MLEEIQFFLRERVEHEFDGRDGALNWNLSQQIVELCMERMVFQITWKLQDVQKQALNWLQQDRFIVCLSYLNPNLNTFQEFHIVDFTNVLVWHLAWLEVSDF